jgi:DNA-binding FadR family transcriptional regulator
MASTRTVPRTRVELPTAPGRSGGLFRKAKQNRVFQDVVHQIQEAVLSGRLKAGDQLPGERELKERFGVSRGTLREGLRVLEQQGLIEIKTGVTGGAIVKPIGAGVMTDSLGLLLRTRQVSLRDLAEFRIGLEGDCAANAARRATPEDLHALKGLLDQAAAQVQDGPSSWDAFIHTDEEFHFTIARTTHNLLYTAVLETISQNIHTYYERFLPVNAPLMVENLHDLQAVYATIERRDADAARQALQDHVRRFSFYMEQGQQESVRT